MTTPHLSGVTGIHCRGWSPVQWLPFCSIASKDILPLIEVRMAAVTIYASFLIRLWSIREATLPGEGDWQGELQHIQSGQRWTFATFDELLVFLYLHAEASVTSKGGEK
jgi:hypothetical protein